MKDISQRIAELHDAEAAAFLTGDTEGLAAIGAELDEAITPEYLGARTEPPRILPGVHWGGSDQRPLTSSTDSGPNTRIAV